MILKDTLRRVNGLVERVTGRLAFLPPLATRIVIGLAFFHTGTGKLRHFDNVVGFFSSLGIPLPSLNAGLVATMETVGGVMLIVGLCTRFFASGLSLTMVVALLAAWGGASELSPTDVTSFTFLLFLLWLVFYGAGSVSADALLRRFLDAEPLPTHPLDPSSP